MHTALLSRAGLESWLNDPGTNLPQGKVVLPTAMKGMVPHAQ
jgi:hypothetical protein